MNDIGLSVISTYFGFTHLNEINFILTMLILCKIFLCYKLKNVPES